MPMSKPTDKITQKVRSEQVLNSFVQVVRSNLPVDLKKTHITAEGIISGRIIELIFWFYKGQKPEIIVAVFSDI